MSTSHSTAGHLAHHFDDAEQQYISAELGMWLFLATEVLFFGGALLGYAVYRFKYPDSFIAASHHLDIVLGTANTVILLTSSLTMALAVHAAQTSRTGALVRNLILTLLLGSAFLGVKGFEYFHKFGQHLVPGPYFQFTSSHGTDEAAHSDGEPPAEPKHAEIFFSFYFALTGLHALHMVIGIGLLAVLIVKSAKGRFSAAYFTPVEMTGLYWHFVDIVWVFLFPLLYLVR
jgi:cytochrome c oxidase subunit 3